MILSRTRLGPLLMMTVTGACSLAGTPPPPTPAPNLPGGSGPPAEEAPTVPSPEEGEEGASADLGEGVVAVAFDAMGTPYRWGGSDANGFDCSGLIRYAYGQFGIDLPRRSRDQARSGYLVGTEVSDLRPGDVLGFSAVAEGEVSHVGLYVGDGRFIHSSSTGVRVSDLAEPYWQQHFKVARRVVR